MHHWDQGAPVLGVRGVAVTVTEVARLGMNHQLPPHNAKCQGGLPRPVLEAAGAHAGRFPARRVCVVAVNIIVAILHVDVPVDEGRGEAVTGFPMHLDR